MFEKNCENCYFKQPERDGQFTSKCKSCENFSEWEPWTRQDHIRNMTTDELSKVLCDISGNCGDCVADEHCYKGHTGFLSWLTEREN